MIIKIKRACINVANNQKKIKNIETNWIEVKYLNLN